MHYCPCCRSKPDEKQPVPRDLGYSIRYRCGSQVVYKIEGKYWEWETKCTVEQDSHAK